MISAKGLFAHNRVSWESSWVCGPYLSHNLNSLKGVKNIGGYIGTIIGVITVRGY